MAWYWIVLIVAVWLPGALWGSLFTFRLPDWFGQKRKERHVRVGLFFGLFLWPLIGYVACVHMLYKSHRDNIRTNFVEHPLWLNILDFAVILLSSLAWPVIFAIQYSLKRMVKSAS